MAGTVVRISYRKPNRCRIIYLADLSPDRTLQGALGLAPSESWRVSAGVLLERYYLRANLSVLISEDATI